MYKMSVAPHYLSRSGDNVGECG